MGFVFLLLRVLFKFNKLKIMKRVLFFLLSISLLVLSCEKDDTNPDDSVYNILTGTATNITNKSASITGDIKKVNGNKILAYGHVWSDNPAPTIDLNTKTTFGPSNSDISFTSDITMLMQGKEYYIRAYATDSVGTTYGKQSNFTTETSFFEFVVSSNYLQNDSYVQVRAWVMIYNDNNELLGIKEISNGQTYSFDPPKNRVTGKYMVQFLRYYNYFSSSQNDNYSLSAFVNVAPDVWYLGTEPREQINQIGTNTLTLTDLDLNNYYYWSARNKYSYANYDQYYHTLTFAQYFNPDKIWIMYLNEDQSTYYKWLDNVALNQSFTLSSSDFAQMTNYVEINIPNNTQSYIYVYSEDDLTSDVYENFIVFSKYSENKTNFRVYFPDDVFNGYRTSIYVYHEDSYEGMTKYSGEIPTQFVSLLVNVSVANDNIFNFSASYSGNSDVIRPYWYYYDEYYDAYFSYSVYGSAEDVNSFSAPMLPYEISVLNESLINLNNLSYAQTSFTETDYYNDYQDYIMRVFKQPNISNLVSEYYYSKTIYKEGLKNIDILKEDFEEMRPMSLKNQKR